MTEEEAKTKWCPFVRLGETAIGSTYNRCGPEASLYCIGSACMAWRWNERGLRVIGSIPPPGGEGHCGLAGKP